MRTMQPEACAFLVMSTAIARIVVSAGRMGPLLLMLTGALYLGACQAEFQPARKSQIDHLPGFKGSKLPSRQFTGHIPVHRGEHLLWYWLVESEYDPVNDPVVLWLTGGPGCSSMDALIYEHGPFTFNISDGGRADRQDVRLSVNPYSWSKTATMIYVDSPVGVGLSYAPGKPEINTDDQATTDDLVTFITQLLMQDYPALLKNDFYIAGESYAGVYVPLLATKLLKYNAHAPKQEQLNFKGYAVGNGVTDDRFDGDGQPVFAYSMGLIDPPTYQHLQDVCRGSFWNATPGSTCAQQLHDAYDRFYWLNPYDILDDCFSPSSADRLAPAHSRSGASEQGTAGPGRRLKMLTRSAGSVDHVLQPLEQQQQSIAKEAATTPIASALLATRRHQTSPLRWPLAGVRRSEGGAAGQVSTWHHLIGYSVPCADRRASLLWLNRDDVRAALHAPPVEHTQWQPCSEHVHYTFVSPLSMIPQHLESIHAGLRVLIYSGDHDFVVPFTGTRDWVYSLGLNMATPYQPWTVDGQVAGFLVKFKEGLMFATVKGAGHMVPQTKPADALHLFTRFLLGKL